MPSLRDFERNFAASLLGDTNRMAFAPARVPGEVGLLVHRDNVLGGLTDALATQYPVVRAVVGDAFFAAMAREFLRISPPNSPLMIGYGSTFAAFLATFPPVQSLPYLPDLARLEYAMQEAYHAADCVPASLDALAAYDTEALSRLTLRFHPSLRLIASDHPVDLIWRFNQSEAEQAEPVALSDRNAYVMIARPEDVVEMTVLSEPAFAFLSAMEAGEALPAAQCRAGEDFDGGVLLLNLFARGLIVDIIT